MKNYNNFLLERSSLTKLGISTGIMQDIQKEYSLPSDAGWIKINRKKDLIEELKKDEKALYIHICLDYLQVIVNNHKTYFQQEFKFLDQNWGDYEIHEREYTSMTQVTYGVIAKHPIYKMIGDNFEIKPKKERTLQKEIGEFETTTNDFKVHILENFNNLVKQIYGRRYEEVMRKIALNLQGVKPGISADELLKFLTDNKKMAEMAKEYEMAKEEDDMLKIKNLEQKYNSLSALDEYLINFEEAYSDKYDFRLNIQDLINEFGWMKIETAFMYYLFSGKIKDLSVEKK